MALAPPAIKDGFSYAVDFFAEASGYNRHRRATVPELKAHFKAPGKANDRPAHWYEAQLLHYGLKPSKTKGTAQMRLFEAVTQGNLTVPSHILKLEAELKKDWNKREREAKKAQSDRAPAAAPARGTKRKADDAGLSSGPPVALKSVSIDANGSVNIQFGQLPTEGTKPASKSPRKKAAAATKAPEKKTDASSKAPEKKASASSKAPEKKTTASSKATEEKAQSASTASEKRSNTARKATAKKTGAPVKAPEKRSKAPSKASAKKADPPRRAPAKSANTSRPAAGGNRSIPAPSGRVPDAARYESSPIQEDDYYSAPDRALDSPTPNSPPPPYPGSPYSDDSDSYY